MKNKYIDTIETVYGVDIVIANKNVTVEDLKELYTYSDGEELEDTTYEAITCTCKNRKTNRYAILVWYRSMKLCKGETVSTHYINTAAHEAFHVVNDLINFSEDKIDSKNSNEFIAYMIGYYTERIYKTWTKK